MVTFLAATCAGANAFADPPSDALLVDGLCVLTGERAEDEGSATPVLLSRVGLEADLLLVRRYGPAWRDAKIDDQTWAEARRIAALATVFARQARQMGETVDPAEVETHRQELIARAGGPAAMQELLVLHGAGDRSLRQWVEQGLLAAQQVRYQRERIDPLSDKELTRRFEGGGHEFEGREYAEVRAEYRRVMAREQTRKALLRWLGSTLQRGLLRLIR
jgi:hypothetical protein